MRHILASLLVAAFLVVGLFNARPALATGGGWGGEDPQLCVNGQLLSVVTPTTVDPFVSVPADAVVDFDVVKCGGQPPDAGRHYQVVPPGRVTFEGKDQLVVTALSDPHTPVRFTYADKTFTKKTDGKGAATAKFDLKDH